MQPPGSLQAYNTLADAISAAANDGFSGGTVYCVDQTLSTDYRGFWQPNPSNPRGYDAAMYTFKTLGVVPQGIQVPPNCNDTTPATDCCATGTCPTGFDCPVPPIQSQTILPTPPYNGGCIAAQKMQANAGKIEQVYTESPLNAGVDLLTINANPLRVSLVLHPRGADLILSQTTLDPSQVPVNGMRIVDGTTFTMKYDDLGPAVQQRWTAIASADLHFVMIQVNLVH